MNFISIFLLSVIIWIVLVWSMDWQNMITGVVVSLAVSLLYRNIDKSSAKRNKRFKTTQLIIYVIRVLCIWIYSSFRQAFEIISLPAEKNGRIICLKSGLSGDTAKAFLMNFLNLHYGILVVNIDDDKYYIYSTLDDSERIILIFDRAQKIVMGITG